MEEVKKHPSYGMVSISRTTGGEKALFGSSIKHRDTISLKVKHGELVRELNSDWYMGKDKIVEVEMSYSQFAELITSMNMNSGVPCTIRYTEKDGWIEDCDFESKKEQFKNELQEKIDKNLIRTKQIISNIEEIFEKKSISKKDREQVIAQLTNLYKDLSKNLPFIYECFNEQMDKTIMESKCEVEAFIQNKMTMIANMQLIENRDKILEINEPINVE